MYLKIESPENVLVIPAVNAGPIVAALESCRAVSTEGWGENAKLSFHEQPLKISFVPDDFIAPPAPPLEKALKNYEAAQSNWLGEYEKRTKAEKEVAELKAKLDAITNATKQATA